MTDRSTTRRAFFGISAERRPALHDRGRGGRARRSPRGARVPGAGAHAPLGRRADRARRLAQRPHRRGQHPGDRGRQAAIRPAASVASVRGRPTLAARDASAPVPQLRVRPASAAPLAARRQRRRDGGRPALSGVLHLDAGLLQPRRAGRARQASGGVAGAAGGGVRALGHGVDGGVDRVPGRRAGARSRGRRRLRRAGPPEPGVSSRGGGAARRWRAALPRP